MVKQSAPATSKPRLPKRPATPIMARVDQISRAILDLRGFVEYCHIEHGAQLHEWHERTGRRRRVLAVVSPVDVERWIYEFLHVDYDALLAERAQIDAWVKACQRAQRTPA